MDGGRDRMWKGEGVTSGAVDRMGKDNGIVRWW